MSRKKSRNLVADANSPATDYRTNATEGTPADEAGYGRPARPGWIRSTELLSPPTGGAVLSGIAPLRFSKLPSLPGGCTACRGAAGWAGPDTAGPGKAWQAQIR